MLSRIQEKKSELVANAVDMIQQDYPDAEAAFHRQIETSSNQLDDTMAYLREAIRAEEAMVARSQKMREELVLIAQAIELEREQQAQRRAARHRQGQAMIPPGASASAPGSILGVGMPPMPPATAAGMAAAEPDPSDPTEAGKEFKLSPNLREQNEQLKEFLSYFCQRYFPRPLPRASVDPGEDEDHPSQGTAGRAKQKGKRTSDAKRPRTGSERRSRGEEAPDAAEDMEGEDLAEEQGDPFLPTMLSLDEMVSV